VKVATPLAFVLAVAGVIDMVPGVLANVTGTPAGTAALFVSFTVTVTVAFTPVATLVGETLTVVSVLLTPVTVSEADGVMVVLPTFAVSVSVPGLLLVTVKVATPLGLVATVLLGEMVTPADGELVNVTFTPAGTGLFDVSFTATVTVAGVLRKTVAGETVMGELALTPLTVNVGVDEVMVVLPAVAVSVKVPGLLLVTVKVATPLPLVDAVLGEMVTPADGVLDRVTGTPAETLLFSVSFTVTVTVAGMPTKTVVGARSTVEFVPLISTTFSVVV
jgi:hypothetical protein